MVEVCRSRNVAVTRPVESGLQALRKRSGLVVKGRLGERLRDRGREGGRGRERDLVVEREEGGTGWDSLSPWMMSSLQRNCST